MGEGVGWRDDVVAERRWREDLYLADDSPLSAEARARFPGLRWWEPDPRFRAAARLVRHDEPVPGGLPATGPDAIGLVEVGAFEFELLGAPRRLLAYEPAPGEADEAYLLVPFRDATSGRETYGGGRYLDLDPPKEPQALLDFNRAYHPYCAFDDAWACVLPPPQNTLALRVEAGERLA